MTGRRLRTVVCGTTFGQFYLAALAALPQEFELVGLLAKGSDRSVACAERYGVPLHTDVDQLPDGIDLACVVLRSGVLGGSGTETALRLLRRGVHVVQEQPVHHEDLVACLREARRHGVHYRVGDLYPRLPAARRFTSAARALLARQPAEYLDAACAVQVAFPLLHLLGDAVGAVRPWQLTAAGPAEGPLALVTGRLGGVPLTLRVHHRVDPADPDNHLALLHRATIGTAAGSLTLTDTHGPVLWTPRLHIPERAKHDLDFAAPGTEHLAEPGSTVLGPAEPPGYRHILGELWPAAIGRDLLDLRAAITGEQAASRPDQYQLALSRLWQDVTTQLGYPALAANQQHQPVPVAELTAAAAGVPDDRPADPGALTLHGVLAGALPAAEAHVRHLTNHQVSTFVDRLDQAVLAAMQRALPTGGTSAELLAGVDPAHHWLVGRWLRALAAHGRAVPAGEPCELAPPATPERLWRRAAEAWTDRLGPAAFVDYLADNADRLPQLLGGEQSATLLLFPQGSSELADSIYRDPVTARYLNTLIAATVRTVAAAGPRPLRVLEVGAGTGATTEAVLAALGEQPVDYLFTDLSQFFLTEARKRFAHHPGLRYEVLDVDDPAGAPGSADVVIAAGVLNNARDAVASVRALTGWLAPGGWLLITEPVREHLEILTSQAFMMTAPEGARAEADALFLSRRQWLEVLDAAGLAEVLVLPGEDHPLAPLGQRLFAARRPAC